MAARLQQIQHQVTSSAAQNEGIFNWAKSVKLGSKSQIVKVKDEEHLSMLLKNNPGYIVKPLGSLMSYGAIGKTESPNDLLLDLSEITGFIEATENTATFGGATVLKDIVDKLLEMDRQFVACPGVLLTQTVGGAIATGTHGQDMRCGGLFDAIQGLRVITADGQIRDIMGQDPLLDAFRLHLGVLGIVTRVIVKTEPVAVYKLTKSITSFDDLQANFVRWNETSEHTKAWWFPDTDKVQLWQTVRANEEESKTYYDNGAVLYQMPKTGGDTDFSQTIQSLVKKLQEDTQAKSKVENNQLTNRRNARFETVLRFQSLENCLGNMYQLWCKGIPAPQVNCEIAVPIERLNEALSALSVEYKNGNIETHYPFILRATGSSEAWLAPSYGRRVVYIGFLVYLSEDFQGNQDRLESLKKIEEVLAGFEALPHVGKFFTRSLYDLERLPKFQQFKQLRQELDPKGVFINSFSRQLLQL
ncbi:FAD binding domain-containing protein [Gorgonomyces haynaldii]|nr:FAD binding domain-containing protein [Gorgonomyces haynaldii]